MAVIPEVCYGDPEGPATSSQEIRGYISVMDTLKITNFLIKGIIFC
jgi:hypothetical protein